MAVNQLTEMPRAFPIFDTKGKMAAIWVLWFNAFIANLPPVGSGYVIDGSAGTYGPSTIFQGADINKGTAPTHGQIYIAVDTGNIYVEQAGAWVVETGAFTGDVTKAAHSSVLTLATVNATPGTFGSSTTIPIVTADAKGRVTHIEQVELTLPAAGGPGWIQYSDGFGLASSPDWTFDPSTDTVSLRGVKFHTDAAPDGIGFQLTGRSYNQATTPLNVPDTLQFIAGSETSTGNAGAKLVLGAGSLTAAGDAELDAGSHSLKFTHSGELKLDGDPGADTQVLTSQGPGSPAIWRNTGEFCKAFSFGDLPLTPLLTIPAGKTVLAVQIVILTAFDDASSTLSVGDAGDYSSLVPTFSNFPDEAGTYLNEPGRKYSIATPVLLSISAGTSSQGDGLVFISYQP